MAKTSYPKNCSILIYLDFLPGENQVTLNTEKPGPEKN